MSDLDVLIAGAGPVGMIAALELARHGVSPERIKLIDKAEQPHRYAKASSLWPRTLELIQYAYPALFDDIMRHKGFRTPTVYRPTAAGLERTVQMRADELQVGKAYYSEYNTMCTIEQWRTEDFMREEINRAGVHIERGTSLEGFQEVGDHVVVELSKKDGSKERLKVKYLIGADGGKSVVRKALRLDFPGHLNDQVFLIVANVTIPNLPANYYEEMWVTFNDKGFAVGIPFEEKTFEAFYSCFPSDPLIQKLGNPPREPTIDEFMEGLKERVPGMDVTCTDPKWLSVFQVNSRQVPRYMVGRVAMLGDACHVHSPVFGQGMNYGIQDAFNLSWKLASVVRGDATTKLLNSYHEERWAAGHLLVKLTETVQGALDRVTKTPDTFREIIYNFQKGFMYSLETFPTMQSAMRTVYGLLCQLSIHYKQSSISGEHWVLEPPQFSLSRMLHRRQVALTRFFRKRLVAGERAPNVELVALQDPDDSHLQPSARLHSVIHSTSKFTILLFEAAPGYEDDKMWKGGQDVDLKQAAWELEVLGDGLIQCMILGPEEAAAREAFGVWGQCAFLVRPDGYVAFRSQPVSRSAISGFLTQRMGFKPIMDAAVPSWDRDLEEAHLKMVTTLKTSNILMATTSLLLAANLVGMWYTWHRRS